MRPTYPASPFFPVHMFDAFATRATGTEQMDDLTLSGPVLDACLREIARINRWLGGNRIVRQGLMHLLRQLAPAPGQVIRIADLGCGGGDGLRHLATWATRAGFSLHFTGLDANAATIAYARTASADFPQITYQQANVLEDSSTFEGYDLVICSLFLHHLEEAEQIALITRLRQAGVKALLINDLQRGVLPWLLFRLVSRIFGLSPMSRHDGALSVRKAFHRRELVHLMQACGIDRFTIRWKWAFRYQLTALIS